MRPSLILGKRWKLRNQGAFTKHEVTSLQQCEPSLGHTRPRELQTNRNGRGLGIHILSHIDETMCAAPALPIETPIPRIAHFYTQEQVARHPEVISVTNKS
jgi:hypothetical protein